MTFSSKCTTYLEEDLGVIFKIFRNFKKFAKFHFREKYHFCKNVTKISLVKFSRKSKHNSVRHNPFLFDGTGQLGQDTFIGQPWTGESGHDGRDRIARAGQPGQVSLDMLAGKVSRIMSAGTRQ